MIHFEIKPKYGFDDLLKIVADLRSPEGHDWDREQTHETIRRDMLEEAYEACEAIDLKDTDLLKEELGDVLLQVVFHADMEKDKGVFTIDDVCDGIVKKLLYRHPTVFFDESMSNDWDALKRQEKGQDSVTDSLNSVARSLPGLWRAEKIQKKAAKSGFEWPNVQAAMEKLQEEVAELSTAVDTQANIEEELGDVLFAAVKVARFTGVDPEVAIQNTCEKFIHRYAAVEQGAKEQQKSVSDLSLEEMMDLWNKAKHS